MPVAPAKVANLRIAVVFSQVSHGHAHALRLVPQGLSRDSHDSQAQGQTREMADPSASDSADHRTGGTGAEPFNPLIGGIDDLIERCRDCWLWPEVATELQGLAELINQARTHLTVLRQPATPDWSYTAALGIARSITSIHEHAERHGSYATAARYLWTAAIPSREPTLSDTQIYALLAIVEARTSAEAFYAIAAGLEDELRRNAIGHDEVDEISWLRSEIALWERESWRWADSTRAAAARFLLQAQWHQASSPAGDIRQAELRITQLNQQLGALSVTAEKFHGGRAKGAYSPLTLALMQIVREARSRDLHDVLAHIEECLGEEIESLIRFDEITSGEVQYSILTKGKLAQIKIDSLRRKLADLPDV